MKSIGKFKTTQFGVVEVLQSNYQKENGPLAIQLVSVGDTDKDIYPGEPIAMLSINMPEYSERLAPDCFYLKNWSENMQIAADAIDSGLFERAKEFPEAYSGFVSAQAYRVKNLGTVAERSNATDLKPVDS